VAREIAYGGAHQGNMGFLEYVNAMGNKQAGNVELLAGLGPATDTATQDQLLNANSSRLIQALSDRVERFATKCFTKFGRYVWNDPFQEYPAELNIDGYGMLETKLRPDERAAAWDNFQLTIKPNSLLSRTPAQKLQQIDQTLQQLLPFAQVMQQQGLAFDVKALVKLRAEALAMPELESIITSGGQPLDIDTAKPPEVGKPVGGPPRKYIRESRGAGSNPQVQQVSKALQMIGQGQGQQPEG
jgi:hypothetical protein